MKRGGTRSVGICVNAVESPLAGRVSTPAAALDCRRERRTFDTPSGDVVELGVDLAPRRGAKLRWRAAEPPAERGCEVNVTRKPEIERQPCQVSGVWQLGECACEPKLQQILV